MSIDHPAEDPPDEEPSPLADTSVAPIGNDEQPIDTSTTRDNVQCGSRAENHSLKAGAPDAEALACTEAATRQEHAYRQHSEDDCDQLVREREVDADSGMPISVRPDLPLPSDVRSEDVHEHSPQEKKELLELPSNSDDVLARDETWDIGALEQQYEPGPTGSLERIIADESVVIIRKSDSRDDLGAGADTSRQPLSDKEWVDHIVEVVENLAEARKAGLRTDRLYTENNAGEIWTEERELLHDSIIEDLYSKASAVPCDHKAIIAGGLGGAGKTTILTQHAGIDLSQYLMINPDNMKEEMARRSMIPDIEGLSPMEASDLAHEESSYLARQLALRAQSDGKNLIWDITMSRTDSTTERILNLRQDGYGQIDGIFVNISTEVSIKRVGARHREGHDDWLCGKGLGGRYVPPVVTMDQADEKWGSKNRRTFEAVKEKLDSWVIFDNSVDNHPPILTDASNSKTPS
jgi:predicted ABC-type ATPase